MRQCASGLVGTNLVLRGYILKKGLMHDVLFCFKEPLRQILPRLNRSALEFKVDIIGIFVRIRKIKVFYLWSSKCLEALATDSQLPKLYAKARPLGK